MPRTSAKRKSDSVLLPTKRHKRSHSPSPSPAKFDDSDFLRDSLSIAKHVKKGDRKSEPIKKTKLDDEYDEDVGRTESQSFLALVEFESKKKLRANKENKRYMEKFEKSVVGHEEKLKLLLADVGAKSMERDTEFLKSYKATYGAVRPHAANDMTIQGFAAMYKKSKDIMATAHALVSEFEEVSRRIADLDTPALMENEWGELDKALALLLLEDKKIGVEKYQRILSARKAGTGEPDGTTSMLFEDEKKADSVWGSVMKKQEKALKRLIKTLDVEVEGV